MAVFLLITRNCIDIFDKKTKTNMNFKAFWRKGKEKFECIKAVKGLNNGFITRFSHVYIDTNTKQGDYLSMTKSNDE